MDTTRNGGDVAFRTPFSPGSDLVQIFCGMESSGTRNSPVDFRLAGLQRRGHGDIWHVDQTLAFSTDECSPLVINGEDIGGNHGHPCAVRVNAPAHGKDCRDVGSLWRDASRLGWTLLRVESADMLLLLSDNIGPSATVYDFASQVTGSLVCCEGALHTAEIRPASQEGRVQLTPAIRHLKREAVCLKDGAWREIGGFVGGCECAEIREVYEVVNPATVAQALREGRPAGGYEIQPSLAAGETMALHRMTYRIAADGTVLCCFDHELKQDVHLAEYLGVMYQEKCDAFGGGVRRYIPKLLPFAAEGAQYDFSLPYDTTRGPMPVSKHLTREVWANPDSPPDRQLDFICRMDGSSAAAFASGFLPVDDGAPEKRCRQITDAGEIVASRKTYPTFAGGRANFRHPQRESLDGAMNFPRLRGAAYKKYFLPEETDASIYTVEDGESAYIYIDFYAQEEKTLRFALNPLRTVTLLEADGVSWRQEEATLAARGKRGYAVFRADACLK